jgi:hypothetical protein
VAQNHTNEVPSHTHDVVGKEDIVGYYDADPNKVSGAMQGYAPEDMVIAASTQPDPSFLAWHKKIVTKKMELDALEGMYKITPKQEDPESL